MSGCGRDADGRATQSLRLWDLAETVGVCRPPPESQRGSAPDRQETRALLLHRDVPPTGPRAAVDPGCANVTLGAWSSVLCP